MPNNHSPRPEVGRTFTLDAYAGPIRITRSDSADLRAPTAARASTPAAAAPRSAPPKSNTGLAPLASPPPPAPRPPLPAPVPVATPRTPTPMTLALIEGDPQAFAAVLKDSQQRQALASMLWSVDPASHSGCSNAGDLADALLGLLHARGPKIVQRLHVRPGWRAAAL